MSPLCRLACVLAMVLIAIPALGQTERTQAKIKAIKVTTAPKLDGVLDDGCWQGLPEYTGFVDGDTRALNKYQTVVRICCDDKNLYMAFHALHPNPSQIKAQETKRNGAVRREDFVAVNIDSLHTHREQSWFDVTAIGTQAENLQRSSSENIEYKGDWSAAGKIVEDGYNVEMAIPFSILVYSDKQDTFGISFRRNLAAEDVWSVWPDLNGTNDMAYYADLTGLDLPKTGLKPKILTYVLGTSGADNQRSNYQGMDIKYPFSSGSLGVLSVNPDFNTIEQQVESVDFSYTERWLEDARPFFSEWNVPMDSRLFYSRRIQDFNTGLKFAGASGPNAYGVMSMNTPGEQNDTVISLARNVGDKSDIVFNAIDHQTPGHRNQAYLGRGDMVWTHGQRTNRINAGYYGSETTGRPNGQAKWVNLDSQGAPGAINFYYDYGVVDREWNGELGYSSDTGIQGNYWGVWREVAVRGGNLNGIFTGVYFYDRDHIDGRHYKRQMTSTFELNYADGHFIHFDYMRQRYEQFREEVPALSVYWNRSKMNRNGGLGVSWGKKAGGDYLLNWISQRFRISKKTTLGLEWNREYISDPSPYAATRRQTIATLNYDLDSEHSLGGRVVAQQGHRNVFFMYRQQVRHGTDAYLIYGDPNAQSTEQMMTLKLVRVL